MIELQDDTRGVIVPVRAHAGARRTAVMGERGGMLRIAVTAPPENGKANRAIIAVLSAAIGVPKSAVEILAGETSSRKRLLVVGASIEQVRHALDRARPVNNKGP